MKTVYRDCLLCSKQWIEHGIRAKELNTREKNGRLEWKESREFV